MSGRVKFVRVADFYQVLVEISGILAVVCGFLA